MTRSLAPDDERARSPWYRDGEYVNLGEAPGGDTLKLLAFLKWKLGRPEAPVIPEALDIPCEVRPLEPAALATPAAGLRVAWLGHASLYVLAPGLRILIDPVFGGPPLVPRLAPPPIPAERLPPPDVLLLTHNHFDHLETRAIAAVRALNPRVRAFVPSGLGAFVRKLGIEDTRALEWWDATEVGGAKITFLPARHWSKRGLTDTKQSHWTGFAIEAGGRRLYVAGDTAAGPHVDLIAEKFPGFDAAVMPIGAYSPRWFMRDRHMNPPEAVAAARQLRAAVLLPVHWGTFKLSDEPLGEPPLYAQRAADEAKQPLRLWLPGDVHEV